MASSEHPRDLALRISVFSAGMFIAGWALRGEIEDHRIDPIGWFILALFWSVIVSDAMSLKKKALEGYQAVRKRQSAQ